MYMYMSYVASYSITATSPNPFNKYKPDYNNKVTSV